jgi:hypothetical protein
MWNVLVDWWLFANGFSELSLVHEFRNSFTVSDPTPRTTKNSDRCLRRLVVAHNSLFWGAVCAFSKYHKTKEFRKK